MQRREIFSKIKERSVEFENIYATIEGEGKILEKLKRFKADEDEMKIRAAFIHFFFEDRTDIKDKEIYPW